MACPFFFLSSSLVFVSALSLALSLTLISECFVSFDSFSFPLKYSFFLSILILFIVFVAKHQANFSMCFPLPSHHHHHRTCYCLLCCLFAVFHCILLFYCLASALRIDPPFFSVRYSFLSVWIFFFLLLMILLFLFPFFLLSVIFCELKNIFTFICKYFL